VLIGCEDEWGGVGEMGLWKAKPKTERWLVEGVQTAGR
jgi:hypothetical protein